MMTSTVLTPSDIEHFIERGYVLVREVFPRDVADDIRRAVLEKIGVREDDPSTWDRRHEHTPRNDSHPARSHLAESFPGQPFMSACTPRYEAALDELMGAGRWLPLTNLGWWPVIFPGLDAPPWRPLEREWHVDGGFFHHHLDSPEQGMLPIFLLSDIEPGDGGTAISVGSHKLTARILRDAAPGGLSPGEVAGRAAEAHRAAARAGGVEVMEVHGRAGDIAFLHPFMLHTVSTNVGRRIRVICNPHVNYAERMNVGRDARTNGRPISAVEEAILRAIDEPAARAMAEPARRSA